MTTAPVTDCFLTEVLSMVDDPFTYQVPHWETIAKMDLRAVVKEARIAQSFGGQETTLRALADRVLEIACKAAMKVCEEMDAEGYSYTEIVEHEEATLELYTPIFRSILAMID